MRKARIIGRGASCYHVMSRINEHRFYLGDVEKDVFVNMMRRAADFSGVEILTFCIMTNHFHILIRVPERVEIADDELLRRLKILYRGNELEMLLAEFEQNKVNADERMLQLFRDRYLHRMYDLSQFMSTLKQRFSIWYNRTNDRHGCLWDGRFKSVLVQATGDEWGSRALLTMGAYIDLNAVRAGLVKDPKDYRWCGYAAVLAGDQRLLLGIHYIIGHGRGLSVRGDVLALYRERLSADNRESLEVFAEPEERLRRRVGFLSCGMVVGSQDFVNEIFLHRRDCFARRGDVASYETGLGGLHMGVRSREYVK